MPKLEYDLLVAMPLSWCLQNSATNLSIDYSAQSPTRRSATDNKPIPKSHRRLPSSTSPITSPSSDSFTFDSSASEDSEYSWNLIPYNIPWGPSYYEYEAGTLPGPEGTCIFLRSPTPVKNQRTLQACKKCRKRKAKCSGTHPACDRCLIGGHICQYVSDNKRAKRVTSDRKKRQKIGGGHQQTVAAPQTSTQPKSDILTSDHSREPPPCGSMDVVHTQPVLSPQINSPGSLYLHPKDSVDGDEHSAKGFAHINDWYSSVNCPPDLQWPPVHSPQPSRYTQTMDLLSSTPACATFYEVIPPLHQSPSISSSPQSTLSSMELPTEYSTCHPGNETFHLGNIQTNNTSCIPSQSDDCCDAYAHGDSTYSFDSISGSEFSGDPSQVYCSIGNGQHIFQSAVVSGVFSGDYPYQYTAELP